MSDLLDVSHLSKTYPIEGGILRQVVGKVQALKEVSLQVKQGEVLALVGGSGCGKSTLAKIVAGLLEADSGQVLWEGRALDAMTRQERARLIQMIFQDPFASLNPKLSVGTQLAEVLRSSSSPLVGEDRGGGNIASRNPPSTVAVSDRPSPTRREGVHERCSKLLESVGLSGDAMTHYPFQFSGGQRQRIAIARALAMQPKLLIADEPLSALDVTTQAQILELFDQLKKTLGLTFLFITHDLAVARRFADRVVVLQDGQRVEEGSVSSVLKSPQHSYTKALLAAVPKFPC